MSALTSLSNMEATLATHHPSQILLHSHQGSQARQVFNLFKSIPRIYIYINFTLHISSQTKQTHAPHFLLQFRRNLTHRDWLALL
jgi:hypothetical protein